MLHPDPPLGRRPFLDQLQVVIAELPEELFRTLQSAGVVVRLERVVASVINALSWASSDRSAGSGMTLGVGHRPGSQDELARIQDL